MIHDNEDVKIYLIVTVAIVLFFLTCAGLWFSINLTNQAEHTKRVLACLGKSVELTDQKLKCLEAIK